MKHLPHPWEDREDKIEAQKADGTNQNHITK